MSTANQSEPAETEIIQSALYPSERFIWPVPVARRVAGHVENERSPMHCRADLVKEPVEQIRVC
jgi:hypothetical protein